MLFCSAAVLGCGATAPEPEASTQRDTPDEPATDVPQTLVRVAMLADVSSVAPGQEFTLGVRLEIEPTWHIYWLNPGEAGLPTEVEFTVPAGFTVGAARYPGPNRFDDPGGIVSYGYEELAVLSAPVTAPDHLPPGTQVQFFAETSWLACREACIRGTAKSWLSLSVAGADTPSSPTHARIWSTHLDAIPVALSELEGVTHSWSGKTLTFDVPNAKRVEYFPSPEEQLVITGQAAIPSETGVSLRISYRDVEGAKPPAKSTGVVRVVSDRTRYYRIDIPWPKES